MASSQKVTCFDSSHTLSDSYPKKVELKQSLSLHVWPTSEKPRERLLRYGVASLSDTELLALFLRSGLKGENVLSLSTKIIHWAGTLGALSSKNLNELLSLKGLGLAKASCLLAAFELGKRIRLEKVQHRTLVDSAEDLLDLLHLKLDHEVEEVFLGVVLNAKNEIVKILELARGGPSQIVVSLPQIMRKLVSEGAVGVVFSHNHPSGDTNPSLEDKALTQKLIKACHTLEILFHDHIIIGHKSFYSFSQNGD